LGRKFETSVEIATLYNEGAFGLNADSIKHVVRHETCLYLWFSDKWENDEVWDMEIPLETEEDAKESYDILTGMLRRMKFRVVK
jgi:hypothetical protein